MKLNVIEREVTTNAVGTIKGGAEFSAKAVKIVVNDMYSDKPRSIARELLSNAYDAHIEAGCPKVPFKVTVPTWLEPTFRIRDYGTGMSDWTIRNVYAVLFKSTKEDTNTALGKWGLGSKTPLSYVDSYSLTSYYHGIKSYYTIMFDVDGDIATVPMGSEPTDEPNGVEVSFPVRSEDFRTFATALREAVLGHDVKPVVTNAEEVGPFAEPKPELSGKGWRVYSHSEQALSGPYARMGCVIYPINLKRLGVVGSVPYGQDRETYYLLNRKIIFDFDIGELEVTSSREDLSYGANEPTVKAILKRAEELKESLEKEIRVDVEKAPSLLEALRRSRGANKFNVKVKDFVWNGQPLPKGISTYGLSMSYSYSSSMRNYKGGRFENLHEDFVRVTDDFVVVISSTEKKNKDVRARPRICSWHRNLTSQRHNTNPPQVVKDVADKSVLWIETDNNPGDLFDLENLKKDFGPDVKFFYVKDMPDTGGKSSGTRRKVMVKEVVGNSVEDIALADDEMDKGGYYIKVSNNDPESNEYMYTLNYKDLVAAAKTLGLCQRVIVVPKTHWSKFKGDQWKDFFKMCSDWCKIDEKDKEDWSVFHQVWPLLRIRPATDLLTHVHPDVRIQTKPRVELQLDVQSTITLMNARKDSDWGAKVQKLRDEMQQKVDNLYRRYPLLSGGRNLKHEIVYIKAVEKEIKNGNL